MSQIVFNFTGPVTIEVSGATTIALPTSGDAPAFVAGPVAASKPGPMAEIDSRKDKLRELLNDSNYRFRKIGTLAEAIDASESETEELLESIGARQEQNNDELWGLISRVGESKSHGDDTY